MTVILTVPIIFNTESSRIFEPEKIAILRSLVFLMLVASVIKFVDGRISPQSEKPDDYIPKYFKNPIVITVCLLALIYILSTVFSVAPSTSIWGSYFRQHGLLTQISFIILFLVMLINLKSMEQVNRLITTAILSSLVVCLYGILQRFQLDPMVWSQIVSNRVISTLGNPIFAAAHTMMIFPFTILRVFQSIQAIVREDESKHQYIIHTFFYLFIAIIQILLLVFSQSRGPFIGFLFSSAFLVFGIAFNYHRRGVIVITTSLLGIVFGILIWINVTPPDSGFIKLDSPYRIAQIFDSRSASGRIRALYWDDTSRLVLPHEPIKYFSGKQDKFNSIRPIIGYGLESLMYTYPQFYSPENTQIQRQISSRDYAPPDRAHNQVWDILATCGLLGLLTFQFLITLIFYYFLKWQGYFFNKQMTILFWILYGGSGLAGSLFLVKWQGIGFLGVGLPVGLSCGFLIFILLNAIVQKKFTNFPKAESNRYLILIASLAAILSHYIETVFGFDVSSTQTIFWVSIAVFVVTGFNLASTELEDSESQRNVNLNSQKNRNISLIKNNNREKGDHKLLLVFQTFTRKKDVLYSGIILAVLITTIGYAFLVNVTGSEDASVILINSFYRLSGDIQTRSFGMIFVLFIIVLIGAGLLICAGKNINGFEKWIVSIIQILMVTLAFSAPYWAWRLLDLAKQAKLFHSSPEQILNFLPSADHQIVAYSTYLLFLVIVLSIVICIDRCGELTKPRHWTIFLSSFVLMMAIVSSYVFNIKPIRADISFRYGDVLASQKNWQLAVPAYEKSLKLAPYEENYHLPLVNAVLQQAIASADKPELFNTLMIKAETILLKDQSNAEINPNPHILLADLYANWAQYSTDEQMRLQYGKKADTLYSQAAILCPHYAELWYKRALLNESIIKNRELARLYLSKSQESDPLFEAAYALEGYLDIQQALVSKSGQERDALLQRAVRNYEYALQIGEEKFDYLIALASTYSELHNYSQAIEIFYRALSVAPTESYWRIHYSMAQASIKMGEKNAAIRYAQQALLEAPYSSEQTLKEFISKIEVSP